MKIVMVSHDFPPSPAAGAVRPWLLATGLGEAGHDVVVLTAQVGPDEDARFRVVSVPYERLTAALRKSAGVPSSANIAESAARRGKIVARIARRTALAFESLTAHPDKQHRWRDALTVWMSTDGAMIGRPDAVIGMALPLTAAVAAADIAEQTGARLVLDFRDLWTDNLYYPYGALRRVLDRRLESRLLSAASRVVVVTNHLATALQRHFPALDVRVIFNAAAVPAALESAPRQAGSALRLGFFGTTYEGRRDLRPVLRALRSLADAGEIDLDAVHVDLYGAVDAPALEAIGALGLEATVTAHGSVPKAQAQQALLQTHIALVPMWPSDTHGLPLKVIEYLAAGRTILVTEAAPDAEIAVDLNEVQGVTFASGVDEIAAAIRRMWSRFTAGDDLFWPTAERTSPFSAERLVGDYLDMLAGVGEDVGA